MSRQIACKLGALTIVAVALLGMVGCATPSIEDRIAQKPVLFSSMPIYLQERIRKGDLRVGDTADSFWFYLGSPQQKIIRETKTGKTEIWIYKQTVFEDSGSAYKPAIYYRTTDHGQVMRSQTYVYDPTLNTKEIEVYRIEFVKGFATLVEKLHAEDSK